MLLNSKQSFTILRSEMEQALKAIEVKHGIKFNIQGAGISYESHGGECSIKIKVNTAEKPKAAANMEAEMVELYGLKGYFEKQIKTHDGQLFIVSGINTRCRKSPVVLTRPGGGRGAKCSVDYVKNRCKLVS